MGADPVYYREWIPTGKQAQIVDFYEELQMSQYTLLLATKKIERLEAEILRLRGKLDYVKGALSGVDLAPEPEAMFSSDVTEGLLPLTQAVLIESFER